MALSEEEIAAKLTEFREGFATKYKASIDGGSYDQRDVDRFRSDDLYTKCFLRSYYDAKLGLEKPIDQTDKVFLFRKEIGLNDLTEASFPPQFKERNFLYWKGVNKDNLKILHFNVVQHQKGTLVDEVKKYIAYFLDQHQKEAPGVRIVLIFDFTGAGIMNMDMDVSKYIISCFSKYFPGTLAYIILFDMPLLLSAAWRVIQSWLSDEQKKKTVSASKADLLKYINPDQLEPHMIQ